MPPASSGVCLWHWLVKDNSNSTLFFFFSCSFFPTPKLIHGSQRQWKEAMYFWLCDTKLVFDFWNPQVPIALFVWDHVCQDPHSAAIQNLCRILPSWFCCSLAVLAAHPRRNGILSFSYGHPPSTQSSRWGFIIPLGDLWHPGMFNEVSQLRISSGTIRTCYQT